MQFKRNCETWLFSLVLLSWSVLISKAQTLCEHGDIRLAGGSTRFEGRVEVCLNNKWGTVCDDGLTTPPNIFYFHALVCRQLGLSTAGGLLTSRDTMPNTSSLAGGMASDSVSIHLDDVRCSGYERGIIDCPRRVGVHNCAHSEDTGIRCSAACVENSVRLANSPISYNSGRVELCYKRSWNTVSDISQEAASVICRQLGFSDTGLKIQPFGEGFGNVLRLGCHGEEREFPLCNISRLGSYNHTRDSGVVCERCTDRCDLGSTRDACQVTTTTQREQLTTILTSSSSNQEGTPLLQATDTSIMSGALSRSNEVVGALLGVSLATQVALLIGWIVSCIIMWRKMKKAEAFETVRGHSANEHPYVNINSPFPVAVADSSNELSFNQSYGQSPPGYTETLNVSYQEVQPLSTDRNYQTDENNYAVAAPVQDTDSLEVHVQQSSNARDTDYAVVAPDYDTDSLEVHIHQSSNARDTDENDYDAIAPDNDSDSPEVHIQNPIYGDPDSSDEEDKNNVQL